MSHSLRVCQQSDFCLYRAFHEPVSKGWCIPLVLITAWIWTGLPQRLMDRRLGPRLVALLEMADMLPRWCGILASLPDVAVAILKSEKL